MKYFIYCRKSSEEDSKQIQSLDTQQRILLDLATRLDLEVVDIIRESKSAKDDDNRPLFSEMLERVRKGEANALLVVHTDRLARNLIEAGILIKLLETDTLREIKTPTNTFNTVQALLYLGFDFVFASHYSRDLSVKVKAGNESKLLKGEYPTYAPVGYINVRPGRGVEPDPIRAPYIKRAFELYASGDYSFKKVAKQLAEEGFRSRLGKKKSTSCINRILTNPEYYGVIRRKGKIYPGNHTALISKEVFDKVQYLIEGRNHPTQKKYKFTYRDFMVCEVCGCKITAGIAKGKYIYYRCTNGQGKCDQHKTYWNKKHVKKEFFDFFDQFTLDPERANKSFEMYKHSKLHSKEQAQSNKTAIKAQLESLTRRMAKLEDMYLEGRISPENFDERKSAYQNEKTELTMFLRKKVDRDSGITLELVEGIKNQATKLSEIFEKGDEEVKRDLLKSVLWNCDFKDGKITNTRLNKLWRPLENLNKTHDLEKWRRGRDSNPR